jgi:membrane protease YdiL (CAAX protease family)
MLMRVLLFFVLNVVLLAAAGPITKNIGVGSPPLVIGAITSVATLLLTIVFVRWDGVSLRNVGAAPGSRSVPRFVVGFAIGLVLVAMHMAVEVLFGHVSWTRSTAAGSSAILLSLLTYLLLASREELAVRGYPLRRLNSRYGLWIAQITVAVVFALEHVAGGATWTNAFLG